MKEFLYLAKRPFGVIKVFAKERPSEKTIPRYGTWILRELHHVTGDWLMPSFPEITWGTLRKLTYIGERRKENQSSKKK